MKNNLKISNIVFTGKLPFKVKFDSKEIKNLILMSGIIWQIINECICPILQAKIQLNEHQEMKKGFKYRAASVSIWQSGAINIVGVKSRKEANQCYDITIENLKKFKIKRRVS